MHACRYAAIYAPGPTSTPRDVARLSASEIALEIGAPEIALEIGGSEVGGGGGEAGGGEVGGRGHGVVLEPMHLDFRGGFRGGGGGGGAAGGVCEEQGGLSTHSLGAPMYLGEQRGAKGACMEPMHLEVERCRVQGSGYRAQGTEVQGTEPMHLEVERRMVVTSCLQALEEVGSGRPGLGLRLGLGLGSRLGLGLGLGLGVGLRLGWGCGWG